MMKHMGMASQIFGLGARKPSLLQSMVATRRMSVAYGIRNKFEEAYKAKVESQGAAKQAG